jgi:hypothetical protein
MNFYKNFPVFSSALAGLLLTVSVSNAALASDTIRVNSGATATYTDSAGRVWAPDSGFVGGQVYSQTGVEIAGTTNDALHLDERWDSQDFSYNFNVTPGTYRINLHEASLYPDICNAGGRVFDVTINGTKVLTNYDMFNEVGCLYAHIKTFTVSTTSNGKINITFNVGAAQNPKINAIEILYLNATVSGIQGQGQAGDSRLSIASSKGGFTVRPQTEGAYTLELSDLQGKRIGLKQGFGTAAQTFSNLKPGVYFLTSRVGSQAFTRTVSVLR